VPSERSQSKAVGQRVSLHVANTSDRVTRLKLSMGARIAYTAPCPSIDASQKETKY